MDSFICKALNKINIYNHPAFKPLLPSQICCFPMYPPSASCNVSCNKCTSSSTSDCNTGYNPSNQPYNPQYNQQYNQPNPQYNQSNTCGCGS